VAVRLDDIIDDDSDFEVSSKPQVSRTSQDRAKYYVLAIKQFIASNLFMSILMTEIVNHNYYLDK